VNAKEFMEANKKYDEDMQNLVKNAPVLPALNLKMSPHPASRDYQNRVYIDTYGYLKLRLGFYCQDGAHTLSKAQEWIFDSPEAARELDKFILEMYPEDS
jgi:hypothetical protein